MAQIPVLDSDPKVFQQARDLLAGLHPDLHAIHFSDSAEFSEVLDNSIKKKTDKQTLNIDQIPLIIADLDHCKDISLELWEKILKYISTYRVASANQAQPRLILTAYQDDERSRDFTGFISPHVFTVLIKPLDELLFIQNIKIALAPDGPLRPGEMYTQRKESTIEIVKTIKIDRLTELGFRTLSSREIPIGRISRYFGAPFEGPGGDSVFAYCYANEPDSAKPGHYLSSFSYFGIPRERLHALRAHINRSGDRQNQPLLGAATPNLKVTAILLSGDPAIESTVCEVANRFKNLNLVSIRSYMELVRCLPESSQKKFLEDNKETATNPARHLSDISIVLLDRRFCSIEKVTTLKEIINILNNDKPEKAKFISLSPTPITSYAQLLAGSEFAEIFLTPLELFYVTRKLKLLEPGLELKDAKDQSNYAIPFKAGLKAAMPATETELSETHVSIIHERAIEIGKIRRFVLWIPNTKMMPEIVAVCRYTEKLDDKRFRCDFLFFALSDHELKYVRLWIKERYVLEKSG